MAGVSDHEGLAPLPGHECRPGRLVCSGWFELSESADLVHLHLSRFLAQFAPALAEPDGQLLEGMGHRWWDAVDERRVRCACEWYPAEPCDQWLLAVAVDPGFEAGPWSVWGFDDRLVLGGDLRHPPGW